MSFFPNKLRDSFPDGPYDGVIACVGGAVVGVILLGGAAKGVAMVMTGTAPTDGWIKPEVNECVNPGRELDGALATGLGNMAIGTPEESCFKVTAGGKVYFEEQD